MAKLDVIKFLVEQQADVMATNARNQTPLDRAIISGDHEVIAYIRNTPAERTRRWKLLRKIIITLSILAAGIAVCVAHFHVLEL
jgi:ankyrin repeat protein